MGQCADLWDSALSLTTMSAAQNMEKLYRTQGVWLTWTLHCTLDIYLWTRFLNCKLRLSFAVLLQCRTLSRLCFAMTTKKHARTYFQKMPGKFLLPGETPGYRTGELQYAQAKRFVLNRGNLFQFLTEELRRVGLMEARAWPCNAQSVIENSWCGPLNGNLWKHRFSVFTKLRLG